MKWLNNILANANIESHAEIMEANAMVEAIIDANKVLVNNLEDLLKEANEAGDEGTLDIFTSYIQELQKQNWMLKSFLNN